MRRLSTAVFFLILSVAVFAQKRVTYDAGSVIYDNINKTIILIDSVNVQGEDYTIDADSMFIVEDSSRMKAFGSITLLKGETSLTGDSADFNYRTEKGTVYNAETKVEKGFFKGEKVRNATDRRYDIENGYFTTCSNKSPHYRFFSKRIYLYTEDRVVLFPVVMFLRDVPVFALPAFVFPIATKRKSGFLMPKVGYDNLNGFYIKNISYFWATNDFSDMTFTGDVMQSRGYILYYEARALVKPYLEFNLLLNYVNESDGQKRWSAEGDYSHSLPFGISLKSKLDYLSDILIEQDYSDTTTVALKRTAQTFLSLSKSFGRYSSLMSFQRDQNFATSSVRTLMPSYTGYFSRVRVITIPYLIGNGLYYSHSHSFGNVQYKDTTESSSYTTLTANNRMDTNYKLFSYLNLNPSVAANYARSSRDSSSAASYSASASIATQIYGTSMFGIKPYSKFRHTLSPEIRFTAGAVQSFIYDSPFTEDTVSSDRNATFSLTNLFEGRRGEKTDVLLRSIVSASYDFDTDSLSEINLSNTLFPNWFIKGGASGRYNVYTGRADYQLSLSADGTVFNPFTEANDMTLYATGTADFNSDTLTSEKVNAGTTFKIGRSLSVSASALYDVKNRMFISSSVLLERDLHCWKAAFRLSQYGSIVKYDFSITLTDIPEISLDKGILGPLFL